MRRLIVRPEAEADVESSVAWYEEREAGLGLDFFDEVHEMQARLRDFPLQFPAVGRDVRRALLDRFPFALYAFLRKDDDVLILFAVLHQRRDSSEWLSRLPVK